MRRQPQARMPALRSGLFLAALAAMAAAGAAAEEPAQPCAPAAACAAPEAPPCEGAPRGDPRGDRPPRDGAREGSRQGTLLRLRGQAVLLYINARVMEHGRVESWSESYRKVTIPGHPVEIKLVGANVIVAAQFTPYVRRGGAGKFLVAQGQIWTNAPGRGMRYHASMQTIPMRFGEPIYFFPLGPVRDGAASIELILTMRPYESEYGCQAE